MNCDDPAPPDPVPADDPGATRAFLRAGRAGSRWNLPLAAAGAAGVVLTTAIVLAAGLRGSIHPDRIRSMLLLPSVASTVALAIGWNRWTAPRRVEVRPDGLAIESQAGVRHLRRSEIGSVVVLSGPRHPVRALRIDGLDGRPVAQFDESFGDFDAMCATIAGMAGSPEGDAGSVRRGRERRQAAFWFILGLGLLVVAGTIARGIYARQGAARRLAAHGVTGMAEVVRWYFAPDGVTRRVEYRAPGDPGTTDAEVPSEVWELFEDDRKVPNIYLPAEPGISRLAFEDMGDSGGAETPVQAYGQSAVTGLMALLLLAMGLRACIGRGQSGDGATRLGGRAAPPA